MIRVAVVHHSALARESLSSALETAGGVAAEWASTAPEMTAAALGGSVDVVLAAAELPGLAEELTGLRTRVRSVGHATAPVVLLGEPPACLPPTLLRTVPASVIPEGVRPSSLVHALYVVADGALVIPCALARQAPAGAAPRLTAREHDVLALIGQGLTNREIGTRLGLTFATVKSYVTSIYTKCGVSSRVDAALLAHGFAPAGEAC